MPYNIDPTGQALAISQDAARGLIDTSSYVLSVFPGEVPQ